MGKTPKKAAPGGDERNLYVRRLKATTAPSRASESSLPERQRESESANRPKLAGIQKRIPPGTGKSFKSKLRPPTKVEQYQATKQIKVLMKNPETKSADMEPESEEPEVKLNVSIQKENVIEENSNNKTVEAEKSTMNKEYVDHTFEQMSNELQTSTKTIEEVVFVESKTVFQEKEGVLGNVNTETKEMEEQNTSDIKLTFEAEQNSMNNGQEKLDDDKGEELHPIPEEMKNGINEKEKMESEIRIDNESCSVDIVESTTSEVPETSESVQNDTQKDNEKINDDINDPSFVSYDSSIMLKDVQIRLNDCLKDNSKLYDVSNTEDMQNPLLKDMSFGKTLRNISGRHSIGRMRHVTLREKRISPNSSLFVNTSTMSMPQDEGTESKVLHYGSGLLSDSFSTNGSPLDRKRKIEIENWSSAKKQKSDEENTSLLNTSINLLKGLRLPSMQISTPKATPYKFESTKLDISGIKNDDNKMTAEPTESTKKWCVIM